MEYFYLYKLVVVEGFKFDFFISVRLIDSLDHLLTGLVYFLTEENDQIFEVFVPALLENGHLLDI